MVPAGCHSVESVAGSVWQWLVAEGSDVTAGATVGILESMKMEIPIVVPVSGKIHSLQRRRAASAGGSVTYGDRSVCSIRKKKNNQETGSKAGDLTHT